MRKIFLLATACMFVFSTESLSQTRRIRGGTAQIVYQINGNQVQETEIASDYTGKIDAFYGQKRFSANFKNGQLLGPFKTNDIIGVVKDTGEFSYKDSQDNWGQGKIRCDGLETFKSFIRFMGIYNDNKTNFYQCITLKKASTDMFLGILNVEGSVSFPKLDENTTITFSPNLNLLSGLSVKQFLPKDIKFDLDKNGQKVDTHLLFDDKNKIFVGVDFKESYLLQASRAQRQSDNFLKNEEELSNAVLRKIVVPKFDGKDGVVFDGSFNVKEGMKPKSSLSVFAPNEKKVIDLKVENGALVSLIKYPLTDTPFATGELYKKDATASYNEIVSFLLMSSSAANADSWADQMHEILSGLELRKFAIYDEKNVKLSEFNLKFKDEITAQDIKAIKKAPHEMDKFVSGQITLFKSPTEQLSINFNETDGVKVNGVEQNQENVADFFGVLKIHSKLIEKPLASYLEQMDPVMKNFVFLGPIYTYFDLQKKADTVLNTAKDYALANYKQCAKDLENEKIDFMSSCPGADFASFKNIKPFKNVKIGLEKDVHTGSFISYDPKVGRDVIYLRLQFKDTELCEVVAKNKRSNCLNDEVIIGINAELNE